MGTHGVELTMYYAQIDNGVVTAVTETHSAIAAGNLIAIQSYDVSLIGHAYDVGTQAFTPPVPAVPRRTLTKLQFLRLMTQEERIAFRQAAKVNAEMEDFMHLLDLAADVDKDDPDVISGLAAAEAGGLLAPGRAAEILA